jgi:hypothetical protein
VFSGSGMAIPLTTARGLDLRLQRCVVGSARKFGLPHDRTDLIVLGWGVHTQSSSCRTSDAGRVGSVAVPIVANCPDAHSLNLAPVATGPVSLPAQTCTLDSDHLGEGLALLG